MSSFSDILPTWDGYFETDDLRSSNSNNDDEAFRLLTNRSPSRRSNVASSNTLNERASYRQTYSTLPPSPGYKFTSAGASSSARLPGEGIGIAGHNRKEENRRILPRHSSDDKFKEQPSLVKDETTHQLPQPQQPPRPSFDLYACREYLLGASEALKETTDCIARLNENLQETADMDTKSTNKLLQSLRDKINNSSSASNSMYSSRTNNLPREVLMLDTQANELDKALLDVITTAAQCYDSRKAEYFSQLKRMKELSNEAIRSATQGQRLEASQTITAMRQAILADAEEKITVERTRAESAEREAAALKESNMQLAARLDAAQAELERAAEKRAEAVELMRGALRRDFEALRREADEDHYAASEELRRQHEKHVASIESRDEDIRRMLTEDKLRLEDDCAALRDRVLELEGKVAGERERSARTAQDTRLHANQEVQSTMAQALRERSLLQAEFASRLNDAQVEADDRVRRCQQLFVKEKQALLVAQSMEIEKISERQKAELKKCQAAFEARLQQDATKLRHLHAQEMNRLLRENDTLQRVISKLGPGDTHASSSSLHVPVTTSKAPTQRSSGSNTSKEREVVASFSSSSSESDIEVDLGGGTDGERVSSTGDAFSEEKFQRQQKSVVWSLGSDAMIVKNSVTASVNRAKENRLINGDPPATTTVAALSELSGERCAGVEGLGDAFEAAVADSDAEIQSRPGLSVNPTAMSAAHVSVTSAAEEVFGHHEHHRSSISRLEQYLESDAVVQGSVGATIGRPPEESLLGEDVIMNLSSSS